MYAAACFMQYRDGDLVIVDGTLLEYQEDECDSLNDGWHDKGDPEYFFNKYPNRKADLITLETAVFECY